MSRARSTSLAWGAALFVSCGGLSQDGCPGPATGSLLVSVTTIGVDPDPDGYLLRIDGGTPVAMGRNASVSLPAEPPGLHAVALEEVAGNCAVAGGSAVQVAIVAGETAHVDFGVECQPSGSAGTLPPMRSPMP